MNIPVNLQSSPPGLSGWLNNSAGLAGTAGRYMTGASMAESRSADITIETMEGDRVTLSFSSGTEAGYQVYNAQGGLDGGAQARLETFTLKSGSEMTIAIEGELSDLEKADIEMVMSAVEEMANEFFAGDVDEALAGLLSVGEAQTIAGLQVSMEISRSFTVNCQDGGLEGALVDGTAAGTAVGPDAQAAAPAAQEGLITLDSSRDLVGSMTEPVEKAGIEPSRAEKHLLKLVDRLFDKIADEYGFGEDKHRVANLVKSEFAGEMHEMAGREAHETDGHDNGLARELEKTGHKHGHRHGH